MAHNCWLKKCTFVERVQNRKYATGEPTSGDGEGEFESWLCIWNSMVASTAWKSVIQSTRATPPQAQGLVLVSSWNTTPNT
jgi:hypothetical protein